MAGVVVENLTKRFGATAALDRVSLDVPDGAIVAILGPSGCGKTTFLRLLAGLETPDGGMFRIGATDVTLLPPERRGLGMMFQSYALFPHMTVAENIGFPLRMRRIDNRAAQTRVADALRLVRMEGFAARYPRQLSGGQQQRVALARAMVFTPHLLLLDEPLSALDKKLRAELQDELKRLHKRIGLTFIYVTHDQDEALSMSDRIVVMRDGKMVQQGSPTELYERPATSFVANFLGKSNFLKGSADSHVAGGFVLTHQGVRIIQASDDCNRPAIGQPVVIALRPEKITLAGKTGQPDNTLKGVVSEWSYLGSQFRLVVATPEFGDVVVMMPTWRHGEPPVAGDAVTIGWDHSAGTLVTDA